MTTRQPEALRLAEILEGGYSLAWLYERGGYEVSAELRTQHARITELESQLAQRFDAADMATAAAQGFRDGATAPAQPVAEPSYEQQRAIMEGERNASLDAYSRVIYLTGAESQLYEAGFTNGWQRASHGQAPAQPDPAYSEACNLATALFKKHFAHLPDYASGQVVWGLFDSTEGVILQIDNMVAGLVQPPTTSPQADSVQEDAARSERERICAAIKVEDDYCVEQGDYMLDSDDCIKIARGDWVRPDFSVDAARKQGATL